MPTRSTMGVISIAIANGFQCLKDAEATKANRLVLDFRSR
jgi:hypothetical protein